MTYTISTKKSKYITVLFILSAFLISAVFALVVFYNKMVNMEHGIVQMRLKLKNLQAENASLHEEALALFDKTNFQDIIGINLVLEKNPDYFQEDLKWPLASQY